MSQNNALTTLSNFASSLLGDIKFDLAGLQLNVTLAMNRIQVRRQKNVESIKKSKKEVAELLAEGKDEKARIKTGAIVVEEYMTDVLNVVTLSCQQLLGRVDLIGTKGKCAADLREPCCTIVYAAPYLDDQPELMKVRAMLLARFGNKFPNECVEDTAISPKVVTRLKREPPDTSLVNCYISAIAKENNIPGYDTSSLIPDDLFPDLLPPQQPPQLPELGPPPSFDNTFSATDPSKCSARGPGLVDGVAGSTCQFLIEARNPLGQPQTHGGDKFAVYVSGPENTRIYGQVVDNNNGTYSVSYQPPLSGGYAIAVHLGQTPIGDGNPYTLFIRNNEPTTDPRNCTASGDGLGSPFTNQLTSFTITAKDASNTPRTKGGDTFKVYIAGPAGIKMLGTVVDNNNGTYTVQYTPPKPGGYAIAIHLGNVPIGNGAPFEVFVKDPPVTVKDVPPKEDPLLARLNSIKVTAVQARPQPAPPAPKPAPPPVVVVPKHGKIIPSKVGPGVIFDNGTGYMKAGMAGEAGPRCCFPTVIGRPMYRQNMPMLSEHLYVGEEAKAKKGILALRFPINHGIITNWEDMEAVWHHTFLNEIRVDPTQHPVFITEPALNPRDSRHKLAEVMFEKFGVPGLYVCPQAIPSLFSGGRTTGVVLDAGDGVCHTVPIVNGIPVKRAIQRLEIGGRDITSYLVTLLTEDHIHLGSTSAERDIARDIKETTCYIPLNYQLELKKPLDRLVTAYRMPDAEVVHVTKSRFMCAEPLFNPTLLGKDTLGLPQMILESINGVDSKDRQSMLPNIVLAGGTSLFTGFRERIEQDLKQMMTPQDRALMKLFAPENRKFSVWLGAAQMAANHETFCNLCVSKEEFTEKGVELCMSQFDF
ncbi:P-type ATPase [Pelomyxa schiedti]|nr:P-type ATPase [Pelomyxa schiedti]